MISRLVASWKASTSAFVGLEFPNDEKKALKIFYKGRNSYLLSAIE